MAKRAKAKAGVTRADHSKRMRFAREWHACRNATQAAIRAGYSKKTAHSQGPRLLEDVEVQDEIARLDADAAKRAAMTVDALIRENEQLAMSDIGLVIKSAVGDELVLHNLADLPPEVRRCIKSIKVKRTRFGIERSVEMHAKGPPMALLADYHGIAAPKNHNVTVKNAGEIKERLAAKVAEVRARRACSTSS